MANELVKRKMSEKHITHEKMANRMGIHRVVFTEKLNNVNKSFNFFEIFYLSKKLDINIKDIESKSTRNKLTKCEKFYIKEMRDKI